MPGVYVTRNKDKYLHGQMWLNYNKAFNNGINGLVVHKTDRVQVIGNVIWDNGKVPKTEPENRQAYAGLTLNHARTVKVSDNIVKTELNDDFAYVSVSGSTLTSGSINNKVTTPTYYIAGHSKVDANTTIHRSIGAHFGMASSV